MLAVIDTNIFVSGLLGSPFCRTIFRYLKQGKFDLAISEVLFDELKFVLERRKFQTLIHTEEKMEIISFIETKAVFVSPKTPVRLCRDLKDDKILECALEAKPACIATGDKDLLILKKFRSSPIINPREFLILLKK